jgi:hypothetical protein
MGFGMQNIPNNNNKLMVVILCSAAHGGIDPQEPFAV